MIKKALLISLLIPIATSCLLAQESSEKEISKFSTSIGLVSRFLWRGLYLDTKPNIQPSLAYTNKGVTLGAWGSYNLTGGYAQTNFFGSYSTKGLTVQVMDHYIGNDTSDVNYFDYSDNTTSHWYETSASYTIKGFTLLASTFIYGGDKDENNNNRYSSYAELNYNLTKGNYNFELYLGSSLNKSAYADGFAIVSAGVSATREFVVNDKFSIPVSFNISSNPDQQKMYYILQIVFK